jgi:parallel beta-helix repeat protein
MKIPQCYLLSRLARLAAISLAGVAVQLAAATYYVSTTGNDSSSGSSGAPFKTIQHAVDQTVSGDIIKIRTGTYVQIQTLLIATPNIEVMPDGTASVTISGSGLNLPAYQKLVSVTGDGVTLRDLTVTTSNERGVEVSSDNVLLDGLTVRECGDRGISVNSATNVTVQYCDVSRSALKNPGSSWPSTLGIVDSTNCNVIGNVVHQTYGEGINDLRSSGTLIEDNIVWDCKKAGIYLDNSRDSIVRYNMVYATSDTTYWRTASAPTPGMVINNEPYPKDNPDPSFYCRDIMIYNNFVYNTGALFSFWVREDTPNSTFTNITVAYNTFVSQLTGTVGAAASGVTVSTLGTRTNCVFKNNILQKNVGPISPTTPAAGLTFSYNNWSVAPDPDFSGTGDVIGNAQLQLGTGTPNANWFKFADTSPCKNQAQAMTAITTDYFGTARGASPDIGGYEYHIPAAPTALTATTISSSQINLVWSDNSSIETGFEIDRATNAGFTAGLTTTTAAANAEAYSSTGLTAGTTYYFRVRATNADGDSANSNTANATTSAGNLLANSGFENALGSEWAQGTSTGSLARATTNQRSGAAALQATGTGGFAERIQTETVTANQTYTISGWVRVNSVSGGNGFAVAFKWLNSAGTMISETYMGQTTTTGGSYVQKTATVAAPAGAVTLQVRCVIRSTTGTAYFDDMSVTSP